MIPKETECMLPLLQYMSDKGIHSAEECREYILSVFNLSNDEKAILKSKDIVGWAKHRLRIIGMLETVSRGNYRITEDGLKFLQITSPTKKKPFKEYGYWYIKQHDCIGFFAKLQVINDISTKIMKVGEIKYFKIVKSLGKIKACAISEADIASSEFGIKLIKTGFDYNYGTRDYYQIELFCNGNRTDISIGQNIYSYIIKNETNWFTTYQKWHNYFTIEYKNENDIKEIQFDSPARGNENGSADIIYYIIYFFILHSEINDYTKTKDIYTFLFLKWASCGTLGKSIDLYKEVKSIYERIIDKYPFMNEPINNGLEARLKEIKEGLLEASLAENNLLD